MSHPSLKVVYWNFGGRAEPIRLALHLGGIAFDDHRIPHGDWPALKPTTPFGAIPTLEVDGISYGQSNAQLRYVGKLSNLYPTDAIAALRVDELLDAAEDFIHALSPSLRESDPEKKLALRKQFADNVYEQSLKNIEKVLERNGSAPFAIGSELSVADLKWYPLLEWIQSGTIDNIDASVVDKYARIVALRDAVAANPKIREWAEAHKPQSA